MALMMKMSMAKAKTGDTTWRESPRLSKMMTVMVKKRRDRSCANRAN